MNSITSYLSFLTGCLCFALIGAAMLSLLIVTIGIIGLPEYAQNAALNECFCYSFLLMALGMVSGFISASLE